MDELHFFTPEFEFLHTETKTTSLQWHLKLNDVGTFEFHTDTKNDLIGYLLPTVHSDVIAVQGINSAWIHSQSDVGGDELDFGLWGKTLNEMLKWRTVEPFTATGAAESIIRQKVTECFMTAGDNYIENLILDTALGDTNTITYDTSEDDRKKSLFDVVKDICQMDNLNFDISADIYNGKFVFTLFRGTDRTIDQSVNNALVLSEDERTLYSPEYNFSQLNYASCGYYSVTTDDVTTHSEIIKDGKTGFYRRETILSTKTQAEGETELAENKKTEQITGDVDILYGTDYDMGDLVTVQKNMGDINFSQNKKIVGVDIVVEPLNCYERPVLDEVI